MTRAKRRSRAKPSRTVHAWIWLTLGVLIGLGISFISGLSGRQIEVAPIDTVNKPAITKEPASNRKFDFYTLLPELEIVIPHEKIIPPQRKSSEPDQKQREYRGGYLLQAGSFQQFNEADNLKARLALMGVEAKIQSVEVNKNKWHRVQIGPSADRDELERLRSQLKSNQIDTILLQAKK